MAYISAITNFKDGEPDFTFYCPACQCNHSLFINSGTTRWVISGATNAPTVRPSLLIRYAGECGKEVVCHLFITDGKIEYLSDCNHSMGGKTVDMKDDIDAFVYTN